MFPQISQFVGDVLAPAGRDANRGISMPHVKWFEYEDVDIFHVGSHAYSYKTSHVALDADGSPRAYHPKNKGIDSNGNAGYPHKGWKSVLVVDPRNPNTPYIQTTGPNAGYFVSKTSLQDKTLTATDPDRYVDSEQIPYIVFPGNFLSILGTGNMGDVAMVRAIGKPFETAAIVADGGPSKAPLGEISLALAVALGGRNPNPRNGKGAPVGSFQYVIFPGSRTNPAWRRPFADIDQQARQLLANIGGWPTI